MGGVDGAEAGNERDSVLVHTRGELDFAPADPVIGVSESCVMMLCAHPWLYP